MHFLILGSLAVVVAIILYLPRAAQASVSENPYIPDSITEWFAMSNLTAFLAVIRSVEANNQYNIIAGGDTFADFSEHPFVLNPNRAKPLGTTAAGAYQMVVGTWKQARDALGLTDFSPASQDKAAIWILQNKRRGAYDAIVRGDFSSAVTILRAEWEAFDKMLSGSYPITLASAESIFTNNGGVIA